MRTFSEEEMGRASQIPLGLSMLELSQEFLRQQLGKGYQSDELFPLGLGGEDTDVACPFCKKGHLRLIKVEPTMHQVGRGYPHHVGNHYQYTCTGCGARFDGSARWMYVD